MKGVKMKEEIRLIKVKPYSHQVNAAKFALRTMGFVEGGDAITPLKHSSGCALLMEM